MLKIIAGVSVVASAFLIMWFFGFTAGYRLAMKDTSERIDAILKSMKDDEDDLK